MKVVAKGVIVLGLCAAVNANADDNGEYIGDDVKNLPLFDAQIHFKEPAWGPHSPKAIVKMMDETDVAMGLVSSKPDAGTITLWQYAPNRIVPEVRPYHGDAGSSNWTEAPGMFEYLMGRLDKCPHVGTEEFHLHNVPKDKTLLRKFAATAKRGDL